MHWVCQYGYPKTFAGVFVLKREAWLTLAFTLIAVWLTYITGAGVAAWGCGFVGIVILVVILARGAEDEKLPDVLGMGLPHRLPEALPQETGPEIMPEFRNMRDGNDGFLVIRHTGGGSARNIKVGRMVNDGWAAESNLVPLLRVGGTAQVTTKLVPITPATIQAQQKGGHMSLSAFVMGLPDGSPVPLMITHENAAQQWEYETDFEIECPSSTYIVSFFQKGRRIRPHFSSSKP